MKIHCHKHVLFICAVRCLLYLSFITAIYCINLIKIITFTIQPFISITSAEQNGAEGNDS